jgi:hypothetical protein
MDGIVILHRRLLEGRDYPASGLLSDRGQLHVLVVDRNGRAISSKVYREVTREKLECKLLYSNEKALRSIYYQI